MRATPILGAYPRLRHDHPSGSTKKNHQSFFTLRPRQDILQTVFALMGVSAVSNHRRSTCQDCRKGRRRCGSYRAPIFPRLRDMAEVWRAQKSVFRNFLATLEQHSHVVMLPQCYISLKYRWESYCINRMV
ncbi:unnamed protein product [Kuraishia capsulata CBS 1993]|uniref:Uncharacterized protein n=1 Tax=Kuraishia capsulata CBS 1993 TaxID=1382522 RepID=W6MVV9_9ASCO|nr:uncharacterized protein KUCA_T00002563001 [Kuraishia capsulata CBS 1993]CDK26590.1 unnamed protein product [Kuraishia capsulata CBS 1993]